MGTTKCISLPGQLWIQKQNIVRVRYLIDDLNLGTGEDSNIKYAKGEERRKQFWKCSKSSFEVKFREEAHAMSKLGKKEITEDLLHYDPINWCRAFFKLIPSVMR
ncbi:hypothetical protein H5410_051375 [Solanum commersonii]|uniref:Uncharacterized protein n=1 Tax=Solanum commersonii TaxID=4109 RepID=A0A9J5X0C7_SOLCO|nr:hypothetical protein H5410_051375 [Solanum commersonii]